MYLKSLEMVGFKSFADATKLEFEPGMTAIVGPNGCGKSNISDAVQWALGEQSAKALRGTKMEDVIFSGTDERKQLAMADVSITFADCEGTLRTEYDEVSVTRRVFRSGEGQYFINKTPCRLKDIQRLFMDTGIGTSSYSLMEQGRIDQILSSRPEDRRTIFEEASGITKFKADKKEAIRKLEHTEGNLFRLSDVIREVKRQIGSLQRQAGKARRYKALEEELRRLDIFLTTQRLAKMDGTIAQIEAEISALDTKLNAARQEVESLENDSASLRENVVRTEREIAAILEAGVQARSSLDHTHELIRMNRQRIEEHRSWSDRDAREIKDVRAQIEGKEQALRDLSVQMQKSREEKIGAEKTLRECSDRFESHTHEIDSARSRIQRLREEYVEQESLLSRLQNQILEIDSRERSAVVQRERLAAEKAQLARAAAAQEKRQTETTQALQNARDTGARDEDALKVLEHREAEIRRRQAEIREKSADLRTQLAARNAQADFLRECVDSEDGFPEGARLLLNEANPLGIDKSKILGALASNIDAEEPYRIAVEAALCSWLDAVLVADCESALRMLQRLSYEKKGPVRLLAVDAAAASLPAFDVEGHRLIDHVKCAESLLPLIQRMLANTLVADTVESIPFPAPSGCSYVTRDGVVVRGNGAMEFWMPGPSETNLLSRKRLLEEARKDVCDINKQLEDLTAGAADFNENHTAIERAVAEARSKLDESKRLTAQKEGENHVVSTEAAEARERLETVTWELNNLNTQGESGESEKGAILQRISQAREQRETLTGQIDAQNGELRTLEDRQSELQSEVTEARVGFAGISQSVEHLTTQHEALQTRLDELRSAVRGRSAGILSRESSIRELQEHIDSAESQLVSLEEAVQEHNGRTESLRKNREKQTQELGGMEKLLSQRRSFADHLRNSKSEIDVRLAESRMRRQNHVDRVTSAYRITTEQMKDEPVPEWTEETPPLEQVETMVAELQTKIEAMGPVNLVAIEEHKELQERHTFLTAQEDDLVKAKQQLEDMIRKINRTTSGMFRTTFDHVNTNFQAMFKNLFDGGSAKLVLVNEEDVLECGIEIIARPPGKRLQNVSLLSGGERTLTAVSLLFAIYMIKPSPFCLLDELDAALDDSNIGRFVHVLKDFLSQSQFIVITHNRQTIGAAEVLYGVTMPGNGVSKIVSMKFTDHERLDTRKGISGQDTSVSPGTTKRKEKGALKPETART